MIKPKNYILLSVFKHNIYYCGIYNNETITSINTGDIFYNIEDFVYSILKTKSGKEWKECLYYNENKNRWRSVKYIIKKN